MSGHIINKLYDVLVDRKEADPDSSYVASLYKKGLGEITRKVGEEATETIIEALLEKEDHEKLASESADLIFHLMVLWAHKNISPDDVFNILEKRFGMSGIEEKAARSA